MNPLAVFAEPRPREVAGASATLLRRAQHCTRPA
jgi:stage V sporulation protein SpoVS